MSNSICNKFETQLDKLIESKADELPRDLLEHAGSCEACRTQWEEMRGLDQAINRWKAQPVNVDLTEKILIGLEEDKPTTTHAASKPISEKSRQRMWYSAATILTALLLLVTLFPQLRFGNWNGEKIGPTPEIVISDPTNDSTGNLSDVVAQFRRTSLQFAVDAGNSASHTSMLIPEHEEWPLSGKTFASFPVREKTVSRQLIEGFSPLGNRLDRAFHDLLDSVDSKSQTKPELE